MKRFFAMFLALALSGRLASAEIPDTASPWTNTPAATAPVAPRAPAPTGAAASPTAKAPPKTAHSAPAANAQTAAQMQAALDQLTQTNHELLDLLKKQQALLQDMQYSGRLQTRQITNLEARLEEALQEKRQLQDKVDSLEAQAAVRPAVAVSTPSTGTSAGASSPHGGTAIGVPVVDSVANTPPPSPPSEPPPEPPPPAAPESYLPPPPSEGAPGTPSWHRLFVLKGDDTRRTDLFLVQGRTWRVVWHNQDKPGKLYANTSALFINAFPKDDTIPQKVSSKLGSGGETTELTGPGNYYLRIEASGGSWELAVEDYR